MNKVVMYNPGVGSFNRGDEIISQAVYRELHDFLSNKFVTDISSHTPLNKTYVNILKDYEYKFVCGSNLLMGKMNGSFRQWDITLSSIPAVKNCILVGVGWWQPNDTPNLYTKKLYKSILNTDFKHSVRDEYTKSQLNKIGINNIINTGCATMWNLTPEFCQTIPTKKSDRVIFTLTDYNQNSELDSALIEVLLHNYRYVYYWPQGVGDYNYIHTLGFGEQINIIGNTLKEYDDYLDNTCCDYVGTRLHGGIRALQKRKRSIILAIDNRAREKKKDFNIPCLERTDISELNHMIQSDFETVIKIPIDNIEEWRSQFI